MSRVNKLEVATKSDNYNRDHNKIAADLRKLAMEKELPHALPLEEAVLGAVIQDKNAFSEVKRFLEPKHFYSNANKEIYTSVIALSDKSLPVDILTVTDNLKFRKKLTEIGGPYYLVGLTNRVTSAANIEYHARIVIQKYESRVGILHAANYLKKLYHEDGDVFDLRNKLSDKMRVQSPKSMFIESDMNQDIEDGIHMPEMHNMVGPLLLKGQVGFFFGAPGTGKSGLAVQIADAVSKGNDVVPGILSNACDPMPVLFLDFELTKKNISNRYINKETGAKYKFADKTMLKRLSISPDFLDYDKGVAKITQTEIEHQILMFKPKLVIVDNITFLTSESSSDNNIAIQLMKKLVSYKLKYDLTLLVLAHTIKGVNKFMALEASHMAGASQLEQFCDAKFGIKTSALDDSMKYLKQFKNRDEQMTMLDNNVLVMEYGKHGANLNFLSFKHLQFERETVHIMIPENDEQAMDNMIMKAIETRIEQEAGGKKCGYGTLIKLIGWKRSKQNLINKMKDYAATSPRFEFDDEAHTYKYSESNPF